MVISNAHRIVASRKNYFPFDKPRRHTLNTSGFFDRKVSYPVFATGSCFIRKIQIAALQCPPQSRSLTTPSDDISEYVREREREPKTGSDTEQNNDPQNDIADDENRSAGKQWHRRWRERRSEWRRYRRGVYMLPRHCTLNELRTQRTALKSRDLKRVLTARPESFDAHCEAFECVDRDRHHIQVQVRKNCFISMKAIFAQVLMMAYWLPLP